jgi:GTP-binding protein EngB required for normal cell division
MPRTMPTIKLNQQLNRIEIKEFEIENQIVFNYFDKLPTSEREEKLIRAIYIGVLALMEDRISAFLSKTSNELGTELESLKMVFDMKKELFYKSTIKGVLAEDEIAEFLNNYFSEKRLKDRALLTGNVAGNLPKNKTGDIICEINGNSELKIVIECKFDKSIRLGDIESKDIFTKKSDTAWSQLIESQANRDAKVSLIVFDISLVENSVLKNFENVGYIPGIGFVAIINSQKGDYSNLVIAYMLARDVALNAKVIDLDKDLLAIIVNRTIKDISEILSIKSLVENNIENNKTILKQLDKSMLLMEFNQEYLRKFLKDGTLSKKDLLAYYSGEEVKDKFKLIEKELNEL